MAAPHTADHHIVQSWMTMFGTLYCDEDKHHAYSAVTGLTRFIRKMTAHGHPEVAIQLMRMALDEPAFKDVQEGLNACQQLMRYSGSAGVIRDLVQYCDTQHSLPRARGVKRSRDSADSVDAEEDTELIEAAITVHGWRSRLNGDNTVDLRGLDKFGPLVRAIQGNPITNVHRLVLGSIQLSELNQCRLLELLSLMPSIHSVDLRLCGPDVVSQLIEFLPQNLKQVTVHKVPVPALPMMIGRFGNELVVSQTSAADVHVDSRTVVDWIRSRQFKPRRSLDIVRCVIKHCSKLPDKYMQHLVSHRPHQFSAEHLLGTFAQWHTHNVQQKDVTYPKFTELLSAWKVSPRNAELRAKMMKLAS